MAPTPVLLPGKSHGRRSLVGSSPWGHEESDTTERLHFHFSLSCTGEGNGNPLQCSCLENPRDSGAWWAAVYGVAQSRTRLKQLSSSSRLSFCVRLVYVCSPATSIFSLLQFYSKASSLILPFKIVLAIFVFLHLHMNFKIKLPDSGKSPQDFYWDCTELKNCFEKNDLLFQIYYSTQRYK